MAFKLVYSKHVPTERCGVAYFSACLAKAVGGQHVNSYQGFRKCDELYINLDVFEMAEADVHSIENFIKSGSVGRSILVMHDYRFSYVEDQLIKQCDVVLNLSGETALNAIAPEKTLQLFTPSLVDVPVLGLAKTAGHPLTLSFGFFSPRKKTFKQYVAFYEYMVKQYPDWYHIIAASGHTGDTSGDSQMLAQMVRSDRVVVTDFMPNSILAELIHAADLGICFYPTGVLANNATPMSFFAAGKTILTTYGELTPQDYRGITLDGSDFTKIDFSQLAKIQALGQTAQTYYQKNLSWERFVELTNAFIQKA